MIVVPFFILYSLLSNLCHYCDGAMTTAITTTINNNNNNNNNGRTSTSAISPWSESSSALVRFDVDTSEYGETSSSSPSSSSFFVPPVNAEVGDKSIESSNIDQVVVEGRISSSSSSLMTQEVKTTSVKNKFGFVDNESYSDDCYHYDEDRKTKQYQRRWRWRRRRKQQQQQSHEKKDQERQRRQQQRQQQEEDEKLPTKYELPKVQVQFICNYDIRDGGQGNEDDGDGDGDDDRYHEYYFDFTTTFQEMYRDVYFSQHHGDDGDGDGDGVVQTELYTAVSINDVSDVTQNHWYYPLCNQTSDAVLTTMEVKGFVWFDNSRINSNSSSDPSHLNNLKKNWTQQDLEYHEEREVERLIQTMTEHQLEDYFGSNVCTDMYFFRAQIFAWNPKLDPPPSSSSKSKSKTKSNSEGHEVVEEEGQEKGEEDYGSESSSANNQHSHHYHHHRYHQHHFYDYDHNLYLLCGGADEIIAEGQPPDPGFMVIGVLVGIIMVGMIAGELHRPSSRRLSSSSSNDGIMTSTSRRRDDYDTVEAIEMTMV